MPSDPIWAGITVTIGSLIALVTITVGGVLIAAVIGSAPFRAGDLEPDPEDYDNPGDTQ